jgi:hypothetical protein
VTERNLSGTMTDSAHPILPVRNQGCVPRAACRSLLAARVGA